MNKYTILIKKDANTILRVEATEAEIPLLQAVHGEENVMNADSRSIEDGLGKPAGTNGNTPDAEYVRLESKYGLEAIKETYGTKAACIKAVKAAVDAAKPKGKAGSGKSDKAAEPEEAKAEA